ncbi:GNAT family acetyltransferase [Bifidobacterium italicum]|uniref:GNAT family acetyltransferase n=2 Tax=Bifidobacterium italicum TaxID=1960968 RepID=A0A2A2ELF7_9BIFI|nr:GNAT family acetyltransferase [Bifidobacterium italicum]
MGAMSNTTTNLTIRRARLSDSATIMDLLRQVNDVHAHGRPDLFVEGRTKYTPDELAQIIADDDRPIFVAADDNGDVLGYAFCVREDHAGSNNLQPIATLYIDDICVDEAARGKHVGTALYRHVLDYARAHGYHNVTLNAWAANPAAVRFYESLGMRVYKYGIEQIL